MHRYFPHTEEDIRLMLDRCGIAELKELFSDVPPELTLKAPYDLPEEMSETDVRRHFDELASRDIPLTACFAGGWFLRPRRARRGGVADRPLRVPDGLHPLPAGNLTGYVAVYI